MAVRPLGREGKEEEMGVVWRRLVFGGNGDG